MNDSSAARETLAALLRAMRTASGRTLRELQADTFASDSALSRYLAGRSVPPWQVVAALCTLTGTDPERLRGVWEQARATRRTAPDRSDPHADAARRLDRLVAEITEVLDRSAPPAPAQLKAWREHGLAALDQIRAGREDAA